MRTADGRRKSTSRVGSGNDAEDDGKEQLNNAKQKKRVGGSFTLNLFAAENPKVYLSLGTDGQKKRTHKGKGERNSKTDG
ncbi:hypothetical protein niasHT_007986 [Heterodera trifolii]|uniref:Uncharacterized protein n=1 Tax=Heterodera trifolii TaxID=157864 RepID=A0ABD2LZR5_9BILA